MVVLIRTVAVELQRIGQRLCVGLDQRKAVARRIEMCLGIHSSPLHPVELAYCLSCVGPRGLDFTLPVTPRLTLLAQRDQLGLKVCQVVVADDAANYVLRNNPLWRILRIATLIVHGKVHAKSSYPKTASVLLIPYPRRLRRHCLTCKRKETSLHKSGSAARPAMMRPSSLAPASKPA